MKLTRSDFNKNGIFSVLTDDKGNTYSTLEHSYNNKPKIPNGIYKCVRGQHRLHSMNSDFITFEVKDIPNCIGILFHSGNTNQDSSGCILLGTAKVGDMVINSQIAFKKFMSGLDGIDEFLLVVV